MKCPKCGYLGFETTDRCRNCQYDFSLAPFAAEPDLALQDTDRLDDPTADFDLPVVARAPDTLGPGALDLDRLFGDADAPADAPAPPSVGPAVVDPAPLAAAEPATTGGATALPFDDEPLPATPRAARPPLGVRRTTPEIPRNRPRTTRPVRVESVLAFDAEAPNPSTAAAGGASGVDPAAVRVEAPTLAARIGAGAIDLALLGLIDALVIFLTLRIAGLQNTIEDIRVLLSVPLAGFFALLAFGYVSSFTVAGGQTIGKMIMKLRVIGDDGRPVDAAGSVLRGAGWMLTPITLGASFVPALFTPDQRALHDRLAGTRVVCE